MSKKTNQEQTKETFRASPNDIVQLSLITIFILYFGFSTLYGTHILHPDFVDKLKIFFNVQYASETLSIFVCGWLVSMCVKIWSNDSKGDIQQYWGYWSILSFSIFGSVVVAAFTSKEYTPFLVAFGLTLGHVGFWTWYKETKAKQRFNSDLKDSVAVIKDSTNTLDRNVERLMTVLDTMPKEEAFEQSSRSYASIRSIIAAQYQYTLPVLQCNDDISPGLYSAMKDNCDTGLIYILEAICGIARSWTKNPAQYFESNIMSLKSMEEIISEDGKKQAEEAFENGQAFFHENAANSYVGFLKVETLLCNHTRENNFNVEPKVLPLNKIVLEEEDVETIPGAPEACETNKPTMIADISKFADGLKTFSNKQKVDMIKSFAKRGDFGSIISLPLPIPMGLCRQLKINNPLHSELPSVGTINLYRHEVGGVKSVTLLYHFCSPLLHIASDLLLLREVLAKKKGLNK